MQILVTGSAGFIGFHLARHLLEQGHAVVGLDNFNDYYLPALKRARHQQLAGFDAFSPEELDLCDDQRLAQLFARVQPELVIHLAAQAGVRYSQHNPRSYIASNLEGFANVLEAVRHHGLPRLIYASSSSVYAGLEALPYREDQRADTPISLYAATKRANELMAHAYAHQYGFQALGLRFFTVYGPWGRPDMAVWIFAERIVQGSPIPVFHHGEAQRDFTYIDDVVAGVSGLIDKPPDARHDVFNVGNNRPVRLLEFIGLLERALGHKAELQLMPAPPGDVNATCADITKLQQAVGYAPATSLEDGIPRFVEWYLSNPEIARDVARSRRHD